MRDIASLLVPRPQVLRETGEHCVFSAARVLVRSDELLGTSARLERAFVDLGVLVESAGGGGEAATLSLAIDASCFAKRESYRLHIAPRRVTILGSDAAGVAHGASTLIQLARLGASGNNVVLPGIVIRDWPDFAVRGVMLDVSRDKVPTMETLLYLVDLLSSLKINQLQLYFEHAFAYRNHDSVWQRASPLTGEEVRALDAYCRERHIELVPNQNSLGHLERWFVHQPYRQLAECPDGVELPFSPVKLARCLCPVDPRSLPFLAGLYDDLLPNFSSRQINVGLDETWELGLGRSAAACSEKGTERVYLDFLKGVHRLVTARGRTMQFWSDIIVHRPELIPELPDDVIALEWGYESDHPFREHLERFSAAGLGFYVCPGTSSWNSIAGRTDNALANLSAAARAGHEAGAIGYLITDWGDNGHLQPLPVSFLGFLAGAAVSWNTKDAADPVALEVAARLDAHVFCDGASVMGALARDLGNTYREVPVQPPNGSALFWLLLRPEDELPDALSAAHLERALAFVEKVA